MSDASQDKTEEQLAEQARQRKQQRKKDPNRFIWRPGDIRKVEPLPDEERRRREQQG